MQQPGSRGGSVKYDHVKESENEPAEDRPVCASESRIISISSQSATFKHPSGAAHDLSPGVAMATVY